MANVLQAYLCLFISPCDNVSNSSQCRCLNKKNKFDIVEGHITELLNLNFKMQYLSLSVSTFVVCSQLCNNEISWLF